MEFLLHEREKKTCFCLSSNSRCQTTLGPGQWNLTSQGQRLAYPLKQMCASTRTLQHTVPRATMSERQLCLNVKNQSQCPSPTLLRSQAQLCGARRGRAPIPMRHWGGELTKICPMHRRAPLQRSPNWYKGNQPRKEETKWFHSILLCFPYSLSYLYCHT